MKFKKQFKNKNVKVKYFLIIILLFIIKFL